MIIDYIKHRIVNASTDIQKMIVKEALNIVPGTVHVDLDTAANRLEMCESCEFMNQSNRKCGKCGCFVDVKTTIFSLPFVGEQHCEIENW